jgi:hypothetical protein
MAEPYLTELRKLAIVWSRADTNVGDLDCRHFFSGAAAYRDGAIVATLTPVGLAFKVPAEVRDDLLAREAAVELSYFPNAPVKRDYVLFPTDTVVEPSDAARLLLGESLDP